MIETIAAAVFAFLLGFLALWHIEFVGNLNYNEVLLAAATPFLAPIIWRSRTVREHRWVLLLGALYLASQIITDIYRGAVPHDYLRGWAKIGLTLLMFLVTSALFVRNVWALLAFMVGAHLVPVIEYFTEGPIYGPEHIYKFQIGPAISLSVFLLLGFKPKVFKLPSTVLAVGVGVVAFMNQSRSLAGTTLLATASYWIGRFRLLRHAGFSNKRLVRPALVFVVIAWVILEAYRYAAPRGMLGEEAIAKYEREAYLLNAGSMSLIAGRLEVLFAGPKVLSSPIIGYGSWAKDVDYVYNRAIALGLDPENMVNMTAAEPGLIPTHSHIFSAWLEAGLAGAVFWGFALYLAAQILIRQKFIRHPKLAPVANYLIVYFSWDLLFSPYSGERRIWNGFILAWMAAIYYKANREEAKSAREKAESVH